MSPYLSYLFDSFPREVGNPQRIVVSRPKEFEQFVEMNDGIKDVFVNIYNQKKVIDKIFFDFDEPFAFEFASKFARWLHYKNIAYSPLITPKKGYHEYVLLEPQIHNLPEQKQKEMLAKAQLWLMQESGCYYPVVFRKYKMNSKIKKYYTKEGKEISYDLFYLFTNDPVHQAKFQNGEIHAHVRIYNEKDTKEKWFYTPACDLRIIGDINRFGRVPNTRKRVNDTWSYCTHIPIDFYNMREEEVFIMKKAPREPSKVVGLTLKLEEFVNELDVEFGNAVIYNMSEDVDHGYNIPKKLIIQIVSQIVNPGILRANLSPEPPQEARFAMVAELRHYGFEEDQIISIFRSLSWSDFREKKTKKQVNQIFRKSYAKVSKKKLLSWGMATQKDFEDMRKRSVLREMV